MANKKRKSSRYQIRHGRLTHETSARRFLVWLRAGLLVLERDRLARVSESGVAVWEGDELLVKPRSLPEPSIRTNAQIVDQQYIYADNGRIRLSRDDSSRILHWRWTLPAEIAESLISDFLSRKRDWDMREQYGWL